MPPQIRPADFDDPRLIALLSEHLRSLSALSPPESVHALNLDGLRRPDVRLWTAWRGDTLLGCGALKTLDAAHGEIKSMRTAAAHLRQGVARAMLRHLLTEARAAGLTRVSLETGTAPPFVPAHRLYQAAGFVECGPFGDYAPDPHSLFMTLDLTPAP